MKEPTVRPPDMLFEEARPALLSLAYRMMGERTAAEDIVQDAWLRWNAADRQSIENPSAWLKRVTTNLAIDALTSARARREIYIGPWLPEPLMGSAEPEGEKALMLAEDCELALLWALERLTPTERAAFILRQVFDTDYSDLAAMLGKSESACRQIVSRAARQIKSEGPRFEASNEDLESLLLQFSAAAAAQDKEALMSLLAPDALAVTDGGGKVRAALRPLEGPDDIATVILSVVAKTAPHEGLRLARVNGRPALVILEEGPNDMILTLAPNGDGKISWIYAMRNPDKLPRTKSSSVH